MHISLKVNLFHTYRYKQWLCGGIKYRVITKLFHTSVAGDVMIANSNYDTKDISRY